MSSNASAGAGSPDDDSSIDTSEYDQMAESLDVAIEEAHRKVDSGRVYDADNEKVRIKWIRALAYAVNVRRQIENDRDLEEMSERLERLEEIQEEP